MQPRSGLGWTMTPCCQRCGSPYQTRAQELSVQDGCLLWGSCVVVSPQGRELVIRLLHEGHPGICRMKRLARGYVWWPGMDGELEQAVKQCTQCQENQNLPLKDPMHPWEWPECPWARIHIDYAGPVTEILVRRKFWSGGPKFRENWSARTTFP